MDGQDHDLLIQLHEKVNYLIIDVQKLSNDTIKRIELLETGRVANLKRIEHLENWQFWIKGGIAVIIVVLVPLMGFLSWEVINLLQNCSTVCK